MSVTPVGRPALRATFGGWVRPRSPGLGPLGLLATMAVFGGLIVSLLTFMLAGLIPGTAVLLATAVAVGLTVRPGGDLSAGARLLTRVAWWRSRATGEHQYRAGAFARNGSGLFPLPGVLASTTVLPGADGYGNDFAVLVRPQSALYTVVLRCRADGASLVDADTVDTWVAGWGTALAGFGHEPGLVAAVVVVDTAPDPGTRLAAEVHGHADSDAPELARQVMAEIVGSFPAASSENTAYVAVTYSGEGVARRSRKPQDIVVEVGRRIPNLVDSLRAAGGGTVEPLGETEIAEVVRVAYDPGCALAMAEARMDPDGTGLTWDQAGPQGTQESWASYAHDSGQSVTWAMTQAPHGVVHSDVLAVLLAPHPDFLRKRVALVYRPHSPATASTIAETDVQTAAFTAAGTKGRVTAASSTRVRSTQRAAAEVAEGAGMTRFATLLTVTVAAGPNSDSELDLAATTAENLAANARLRLRRVVGSQAAGFAASLPVGFLPWRHTVIPDTVRELL